MDRLLTPTEVAARVRRPIATVRYWRFQGTGPRSANVAGRVLYRESDVEAWIAEQFEAANQDHDAVAAGA
jgi:DNA-binding transcriptional MerR regulator